MRILHIEKFLPPTGGVGSVLRRLGELQRQRGHVVRHFGCVPAGGPPEMPAFEDFTGSRSPRALWRMIHNREAAEKLETFLRRWPADIAHLHNIYHHLTPSILPLLARRGMGVVMTVHDYRLACPTKHFLRPDGPCTRCLAYKFYHAASPGCAGPGGAGLGVESYVQRLTRRYARWVDAFLCPSEFLRDVLVQTGLPRGKVHVLRNVIEAPAVVQDPRGLEILWAGRLSEEKAPLLALDLAQRLPDIKVLIAGDGPLGTELRQEAQTRNLENVEFLGLVPHERMGELLSRSSAVVLTSRWFENSPMIMLEAMAAGRCVVVPDQPPLREWVQDGQTGGLFVSGDADSLAAAVREVLSDSMKKAAMEQAAGALIAERHDTQTLMDRLEGFYKDAIRRCGLR